MISDFGPDRVLTKDVLAQPNSPINWTYWILIMEPLYFPETSVWNC